MIMDHRTHETETIDMDTGGRKKRAFLAMIPRGLEHKISTLVQDTISDVQISILGEGDDESSHQIGTQAREALVAQHERKQRPDNPWFGRPVGTAQVPTKTQHVSIGYTDTDPLTWSVSGTLEGTVWMKLETENLEKIASLRCLGPLMALLDSSSEDFSSLKDPKHSQADLILDFKTWLSKKGEQRYLANLDNAMDLWKAYVAKSWKNMLSRSQYDSLQQRIQENKIRFRLSGLRDQVDASYPRHDFLTEAMEEIGKTLFPSYPGSASRDVGWSVNLKQFDIEFVIVCLANGFMAMGISLMPYPFLDAKSFSKGVVPPDISSPYIGGETLEGLVRLRPTTAHVLLHIAQVQQFEILLDPCAGIGTIPLEADVFAKQCIGLGGDIALNHPIIAAAAAKMEQTARGGTTAPASLMIGFDAAHLPVRDSSIDVCVSDLPFGKQCLSSNALKQLLPLVFLECARVSRPNSGRMVLLCGSPAITESLSESKNYWNCPCTISTPVNIGGLQAWIFRIDRNGVKYNAHDHPKRIDRLRTLTRKRDLVARHSKAPNHGKKTRRIQG